MLNTHYLSMRDTVEFILVNALKYEWSLQGFGMLRLYLGKNTRLHVWDSRYKSDNPSLIHTHPWDFTSFVIAGQITNQEYYTKDRMSEMYTPGLDVPRCTLMGARIRCGVGGGLTGEGEQYTLYKALPRSYVSGESYSQIDTEIHSSHPVDGTVTLVYRKPNPDPDHAMVFWEPGDVWRSAEPRPATPAEVAEITSMALLRWWGNNASGK